MSQILKMMSPNILGEFLLELFFDPEKGRGFYSNFTPNPDVVELPETIESFEEYDITEVSVHHYRLKLLDDVDVFFDGYWDHDGCVTFSIPSLDIIIHNDDIKKSHTWKFGKPLISMILNIKPILDSSESLVQAGSEAASIVNRYLDEREKVTISLEDAFVSTPFFNQFFADILTTHEPEVIETRLIFQYHSPLQKEVAYQSSLATLATHKR